MNLKLSAAIFISTLLTIANAGAEQIEQRVAKSGAVFTRDTSNPQLGVAYSDPSGLIWGEVISDSMNHTEATSECESRGARLPTRAEFLQLARFLGHDDSLNYAPQGFSPFMADDKTEVLPGFSSSAIATSFWTSTVSNNFTAYSISGYWLATWPYREYSTDYYLYKRSQKHAVRCVSSR